MATKLEKTIARKILALHRDTKRAAEDPDALNAEVEAMYRRQPWMRAWGEHFFCKYGARDGDRYYVERLRIGAREDDAI